MSGYHPVLAMARIVTIVGARPQFVKAAVVSRALREAGADERIIHTGQHSDAAMSSVFFDELGIPAPSSNLGIAGGCHGEQTGAMMAAIERELRGLGSAPDGVLVYGDTNSTLAGALVAAKLNLPVIHVEAGLRSRNRRMPEEVNRVVVDHLSSVLLCPTEGAVVNLAAEGIREGGFPKRDVRFVGDVMLDAAMAFREGAERAFVDSPLTALPAGGFVLVTVHRAENTDDRARLSTIVSALRAIAHDMPVVWPVHPRTRRLLPEMGLHMGGDPSGLRLVEPLGYLGMLALERRARCILTDSGGVQKEAFFAGVPCVTVRDETEWVELVDAGWNRVVPPTSASSIVEAVRSSVPGKAGFSPYGDGDASGRIAQVIVGRG